MMIYGIMVCVCEWGGGGGGSARQREAIFVISCSVLWTQSKPVSTLNG